MAEGKIETATTTDNKTKRKHTPINQHNTNSRALTLDLVGAVPLLLLVEEQRAHLGQLRPPDLHLFLPCRFVVFVLILF